jgi:hypothetical protein
MIHLITSHIKDVLCIRRISLSQAVLTLRLDREEGHTSQGSELVNRLVYICIYIDYRNIEIGVGIGFVIAVALIGLIYSIYHLLVNR